MASQTLMDVAKFAFAFYAFLALVLFACMWRSLYKLILERRRDYRIRKEGIFSLFILVLVCFLFLLGNLRYFISIVDQNLAQGHVMHALTVIAEFSHHCVVPLVIFPMHYLFWLASGLRLSWTYFILRTLLLLTLLGVGLRTFTLCVGWRGEELQLVYQYGFYLWQPVDEYWVDYIAFYIIVGLNILLGGYIWVQTATHADNKRGLMQFPHFFILMLICCVILSSEIISKELFFYLSNLSTIVFMFAFYVTYEALRSRDRTLAFPFESYVDLMSATADAEA